MTRRIYLVGTDTGVGKTALACALLRRCQEHHLRIIPFKPAQSGDTGPTDVARLLAAAMLPTSEALAACPLQYEAALAPGLAEAPAAFVRPSAANAPPRVPAMLSRAASALEEWIARLQPDLVLVEGAGGLHVPMPGGTWQPDWIRAMADHVVVVGRAGLGTINHGLLTIDALRALGLPPVGFYLCDAAGTDDPSRQDNATVIANARHLPHLGTLPHASRPDGPGPSDLLGPLLSELRSL